MAEHFLAAFADRDRPLVYATYLNGVHFATQWTQYVGPVADLGPGGSRLHEFRFFLEMDPTAAGQGGSVIQQRSTLICDDKLLPVRYQSHVAGVTVSADFTPDEVHIELPDGSRQSVPRAGAGVVIEANMIGQQALLLALAHAQGRLTSAANFTTFVLNHLLPTPYTTTPAPDLAATGGGYCLRSSHEEEIHLSADGALQRVVSPNQAMESRLADPQPPLPAWHDQTLTRKVARYTPPANARFASEDVEIAGPVTPLGATVTIPPGQGPFKALLFLSGSGTHDRNGIAGEVDLGTHELLDQLAERGYLGLRYDTRGAGKTKVGADLLEQGLDALITDARACLSYLRSRPEVDPNQIYLVGHSQGGTLALELAGAADAPIAGVILMAAIGRGIDEVLIDQTVTQGQQLGLAQEQIDAQVRNLRDFVGLVTSGAEWTAGQIPDHLFSAARSRKWFQEHLAHRTTDLMKKLRCPILICQGTEDFQVSPVEDAPRLLAAAGAAHLDARYALLPGLDHLFKSTGGRKSTIAQYFEEGRPLSASLLSVIEEWLKTARPAAQPLTSAPPA